MRRRKRWAVVIALCASFSCAHIVQAAWAVTSVNAGSTFATGSIAAPTALAVNHVGAPRSDKLTWTLPGVAQQGTGQTISSNVDGGAYSNIAALAGGAVAYTDNTVVGDTTYCYKVTTTDALWTAATAPTCSPAFAPLGAVNAGGGAAGNYMADALFAGGATSSTAAVIDTSLVPNPAPQAVYQTERHGNFTYSAAGLPANAPFQVRLQEVETTWSSAGQRMFNVKINGVQVMTNYDIFAATGAKNKAIALTFNTTADAGGTITVQFISVKDNATVSGLALL
ncbi:MAG TPA: malectin domain-containing carbohydrate-binding protein [Candidatus Dormibacteraeota bacterium]